jgi:adenylylsulfate kinase
MRERLFDTGPYREAHLRSAAKAVSWRLLGTLATSLLVLVFTRQVVLSLAVGALEFASKIGLYWLHERLWDRIRFGKSERPAAVLWFTGLSGAGKSTVAQWVAEELRRRGHCVEHLDGDTIREIFPDTGFRPEQRDAHVRRVGYLASRLEQHGVVVVASLISPARESRDFVRRLCANFVEVYVATPLDECERRDPKGLYARARRGEITNFTGIDDPYEPPLAPEVAFDTRSVPVEQAGQMIVQRLHATWGRHRGTPRRARVAQHPHPARGLRELQAAGDALVDR